MLIGISGNIGSGKTTLANELISKYGFREYSFAEPIKRIGLILGFEYYQLYGTQIQKKEINSFWGISGREFMQKFGTEVCRDVLPEIIPNMKFERSMWIKLAKKFVEENGGDVVISDIRFPDEAKFVKDMGGIIIKIIRNPEQKTQNNHQSENQIINIEQDVIIDNNGTLKELSDNILTWMNYYSNNRFR